MSDAPAADGAAPAPSSGGSKGPLILGLVNILVALAAIGMLTYTKLIFKRPKITELSERQKFEIAKAKRKAAAEAAAKNAVRGYMTFEPFMVNINPGSSQPAALQSQEPKKLHYVKVGFSLELNDVNKKEKLEDLQPQFMDKMLTLFANQDFHELTTVQGRYVLRSKIMDIANDVVSAGKSEREILVTNVFFNEFMVQ